VLTGILLALTTGCLTSPKPAQDRPSGTVSDLRNNTYSLLYDLLQDERHLSKLLIVKRESRDLNRLVKKISDLSAIGADRIKAFALADRSLQILTLSLPPGEVATRKAIADTKKHLLLGTSGREFERNLLLTQLEALNYGSHLAKVAAQEETNGDRAAFLRDIGKSLNDLHAEVSGLLFRDARPE
jgi:hypothetical protein